MIEELKYSSSKETVKKLFDKFMEDDKHMSEEFWKHFGDRKASVKIPMPLSGVISRGVVYDEENRFDVRMLSTIVHDRDKKLFFDIVKFVSEYFVNNLCTPATPMTLLQYRALLARRMIQCEFADFV